VQSALVQTRDDGTKKFFGADGSLSLHKPSVFKSNQ